MMTIRKLTVKYSGEEDRLCFAAEAPDGNALLLWMTARLTNRLVECLLNKLERAQTEVSSDRRPVAKGKQQALQEWEQAAANLTRKPTPAVMAPKSPSSQYLIRSVSVGEVGKGFGLVFRWAKDEGAQAVLSAVELRQLLQIVHSQFKEAGWPLGVWPSWYDQQARLLQPSQNMHLH